AVGEVAQKPALLLGGGAVGEELEALVTGRRGGCQIGRMEDVEISSFLPGRDRPVGEPLDHEAVVPMHLPEISDRRVGGGRPEHQGQEKQGGKSFERGLQTSVLHSAKPSYESASRRRSPQNLAQGRGSGRSSRKPSTSRADGRRNNTESLCRNAATVYCSNRANLGERSCLRARKGLACGVPAGGREGRSPRPECRGRRPCCARCCDERRGTSPSGRSCHGWI